jgi:membrane protease YdiL (CAAX protease family)
MHDPTPPAKGWPQPVPWSGLELLLAFVLVHYIWMSVAHEALRRSGFYRWYYGPWQAALVSAHGRQPPLGEAAAALGGAAVAATEQLYHSLLTRMGLWVRLLAFPLQVLTYPLVFARLSNTRAEQLGLTRRRLGRNLLAGVVVLAGVIPAVLTVHLLVQQLYRGWRPEDIQSHPLAELAEQSLTGVEWGLWLVNLMVLAPVIEELTFRGALQPWLARRSERGHLGMALCLVLTLYGRGESLWEARHESLAVLAETAAPVLFVLALIPVYLLVCRHSASPVGPGIFAASLLFACAHSAVWPSPVPLFVLGLGLGILAYRSQSLVGPFVMHGLFNGVNCLLLLWA